MALFNLRQIAEAMLPRKDIVWFSDIPKENLAISDEVRDKLRRCAESWDGYVHADYENSYGEFARNKNRCNFEDLYINRRAHLAELRVEDRDLIARGEGVGLLETHTGQVHIEKVGLAVSGDYIALLVKYKSSVVNFIALSLRDGTAYENYAVFPCPTGHGADGFFMAQCRDRSEISLGVRAVEHFRQRDNSRALGCGFIYHSFGLGKSYILLKLGSQLTYCDLHSVSRYLLISNSRVFSSFFR